MGSGGRATARAAYASGIASRSGYAAYSPEPNSLATRSTVGAERSRRRARPVPRNDEAGLPERLGAPKPVNRRGGPDGAEEEGAHQNDRQHGELERFHRSRMEGGSKRGFKESADGRRNGSAKVRGASGASSLHEGSGSSQPHPRADRHWIAGATDSSAVEWSQRFQASTTDPTNSTFSCDIAYSRSQASSRGSCGDRSFDKPTRVRLSDTAINARAAAPWD